MDLIARRRGRRQHRSQFMTAAVVFGVGQEDKRLCEPRPARAGAAVERGVETSA
jgi:hypothetical protein